MSCYRRLCSPYPRNHRQLRIWIVSFTLLQRLMGPCGNPILTHNRSRCVRQTKNMSIDCALRVDVISAMLDPASVPLIDMPHLQELCSHGMFLICLQKSVLMSDIQAFLNIRLGCGQKYGGMAFIPFPRDVILIGLNQTVIRHSSSAEGSLASRRK